MSGGCATAATTSTPCCGDTIGAGPLARQRLVPGPPRLERSPRVLRRPARADRPARGRVRRRPPAGRRSPTTAGGRVRRRSLADDLYDGQTIDARLRDDAWSVRSRAGGLGGRRGRAVRRRAAGAVRRTARRPPGELAPGRDLDLAVGTYVGRLRAEPGRLAALHGARRGGPARSRCGTRRCSRTASSASARCGRPRPPTGSCSAGATTSSSRPRPSTGSATPRSPAGPAS